MDKFGDLKNGWIDNQAFGYPVKFVYVSEKVKGLILCRYYVFLCGQYIGIIEQRPPGSILWGISDSGPCVFRHTSMIGCVREYVLKNILYVKNPIILDENNKI